MTEVTAYEIFNKIDNKNYTLYVEWFNLCLKIMLLNSTIPPLTGEVSVQVGKARNLNLIESLKLCGFHFLIKITNKQIVL